MSDAPLPQDSTETPPPVAAPDKSHAADRSRQDAKLPDGAKAIQKLSDAGFGGDEIAKFKAEKTQTLLAAGFVPKEITEYWGDQPPDLSKLTNQITSNIAAARPAKTPEDMFRAGLQMSSTSLPFGPPNIVAPEHQNLMEKILYQAGVLVGDLPAMTAGYVGGAAAGGAVAGPVGALAAGGAVGAALPEAIRESLMDYYNHAGGQAKDWPELWSRVSGIILGTGKAAAIGGVAAPIGGAVGGRVAAAGGSALATAGADLAANAAAGTVAGAALEGHVPTAEDFLVAGTLAVGMVAGSRAAGHVVGTQNRVVPSLRAEDVAANARGIYAKTGLGPMEVLRQAQEDPAVASALLAPRAADGSFVHSEALTQIAPPAAEPHTPEGQIKPPDTFKVPTAASATRQQPEQSRPDIAIGDSIAAHLIRRAGIGGQEDRTAVRSFRPGDTAVSGYNPVEIRDQVIPQIPDEQIKGKNVILSTGASNGPGQLDAIPGQIAALRDRGAKSISIMGVGTKENLSGVNDRLKEIADKAGDGVTFLGPLKHVAADQIHSSNPAGEIAPSPTPTPLASSANILGPYATGNARVGGPSGVERINPEFATRIDRMVREMPPEVRARFEITSGFRDPEREAQVYAEQHPGQPVPTQSHHNFGMAVDTTNDPAVLKWINEHGHEYGVGYTINHLPGEQNHLEPTENGRRIANPEAWARGTATNHVGEMPGVEPPLGPSFSWGSIPKSGEDVSPELLNVFHTLEGSGVHEVSPAGAVGRGQIMPDTARQYGFDPARLQEPGYNETVTRHVIADLAQKFNGNIQDMLVAYNAGPGRARAWIAGGRKFEHLPVETQHHLENAERKGFLDKGYVKAQNDRQLTVQGDDGAWVPPETPEGEFDPYGRREPPLLREIGGGGAGGEPPRLGGPEPGEEPPKRVPYETMSDEAILSSIYDHNVGDLPEDERGAMLRVREAMADQVGDFRSELARARDFDREHGIERDAIGAEDMLRQTKGSMGRARYFARWGTLDPITLRQTSDASRIAAFQAVKNDGGNIKDFFAYMMAHRNEEKRGQGIDTGGLPELDKEAFRPSIDAKYQRGAETWRHVNNGVIDYGRDSGLFSTEGAENIKNNNLWHIKYDRILDPEFEAPRTSLNRGFTVRRAAQEMVGSKKPIAEPLVASLRNDQTIIAMADRNRAIGSIISMDRGGPPEQALFQFVGAYEPRRDGTGRILDEKGQPLTDKWETVDGQAIDPGTVPEDEQRAMDTFATYRASRSALGKGDFLYFNQGKPEIWHSDNPEIADLLRISTTAPPKLFQRMLQGVARLQRTGITSMVSFPIRALTHANVATAAFGEGASRIPYRNVMQGVMDTWNQGDAFRRWHANGGAMGAMSTIDADLIAREAHNIFVGVGAESPAWNAFRHPIEAMRAAQEMIDTAGRVGVFKTNEAEIGAFKAAMRSRVAFFDYAEGRAASWLRTWATYQPFMETAFKDFEQVYRAIAERPKETAIRAGLVLTAPSVVLFALNWLADKTLPEGQKYSEIPQQERDRYWITPPILGSRLRIMKPYVGALPFAILPERMLDWLSREEPQSLSSWAETAWEQVVAPFTPSLLAPIAESVTDRNFYRGNRLIPAHLEGLSAYKQFTPYTTETAKGIARLLGPSGIGLATGSEGVANRLPLVNPIATDEYVRRWAGTLPFEAAKLLETPIKPHPRPWDMSDIPGLGSFIERSNPGGQETIERFYSDLDTFRAAHGDLRAGLREGNIDDLSERQQLTGSVFPAVEQYAHILKEMRGLIKSTGEDRDMKDSEKRQIMDETASQMVVIAGQGREMMKQFRQAPPPGPSFEAPGPAR